MNYKQFMNHANTENITASPFIQTIKLFLPLLSLHPHPPANSQHVNCSIAAEGSSGSERPSVLPGVHTDRQTGKVSQETFLAGNSQLLQVSTWSGETWKLACSKVSFHFGSRFDVKILNEPSEYLWVGSSPLTCCLSMSATLSFLSSSPSRRWLGGQSGSWTNIL